MRTAVIAGATGLVGGRCLAHLLDDERVGRVVALVRRPLALAHPKLTARTVDFAALSADAIPKDVDDAFCALGTTMKQAGSQEAFLAVDERAVLAFARACRQRGARRFVLVSSLGADPRSMNFYLRTKGQVEQAIAAMGYETLHVLQPSILDGERPERRPGEELGLTVMRGAARLFGAGWKYAPIPVDIVGKAMVRLAFSEVRGVHVHPSKALHALAG